MRRFKVQDRTFEKPTMIKGDRETVGLVDRAYPGDIGLSIIRMDGLMRRNAKTGIGENVVVKKAEIKEAKKVTIAPISGMVKAPSQLFKTGLLGRAIVKGDLISIGGTRKRRDIMSESPFDEIFKMLEGEFVGMGFGLSDIKFVVVDTAPKQSIIVTEQTEVVFNPEAIEIKEELVPGVTYEDIGGLTDEVKKVREMVELPLKHPEILI